MIFHCILHAILNIIISIFVYYIIFIIFYNIVCAAAFCSDCQGYYVYGLGSPRNILYLWYAPMKHKLAEGSATASDPFILL